MRHKAWYLLLLTAPAFSQGVNSNAAVDALIKRLHETELLATRSPQLKRPAAGDATKLRPCATPLLPVTPPSKQSAMPVMKTPVTASEEREKQATLPAPACPEGVF